MIYLIYIFWALNRTIGCHYIIIGGNYFLWMSKEMYIITQGFPCIFISFINCGDMRYGECDTRLCRGSTGFPASSTSSFSSSGCVVTERRSGSVSETLDNLSSSSSIMDENASRHRLFPLVVITRFWKLSISSCSSSDADLKDTGEPSEVFISVFVVVDAWRCVEWGGSGNSGITYQLTWNPDHVPVSDDAKLVVTNALK